MPGKMRAALEINFSHDVMKIMRRIFRKKLGPLTKKMIYFTFLQIVRFSKGVPGKIANVFNAFLLDTALLGFSLVALSSQMLYVKFYKAYFGGQKCSLIH